MKLKNRALKIKHLCSIFVVFFSLYAPTLNAQTGINEDNNGIISEKSNLLDSLHTDSVSVSSDSTNIKGAKKAQGDIETTINYFADSIKMDVTGQIVKLFGNAKIVYGDIELKAAIIDINYASNIITAKSVTDSTGKEIGKPEFKDGSETYETDNMKYNFKTKKALIDGVVTMQGEAVMHGEKVFKNQRDELYIANAKYTTCNLEEPHFHIQASRIKVIPGKKIISGPFFLKIQEIPTPIGFAFGMFPVPKEKSSGIIFPTYGEERRRGFYLRNGGYYFALSDYIDLNLMGEIYSKGSWGLNVASTYKKRYAFGGNFNVRYNNQKSTREGDSTVINDLWINWNHTPQSKGSSRFSASVSAGTSSYNQNNPSLDLRNTLNQEFNSSISFSKTFKRTPFSMSASSRLQQNVSTGLVNLLLPELALNMSRQYPFKFGSSSSKNWIQKISFSWNMNMTNRMTNKNISNPGFDVVGFDPENNDIVPLGDMGFNELWKRSKNGMKHQIPVSTSMNFFKYITFSPSFSYSEIWYFKELSYEWDEEENAVRIDTLQKFNRLYNYSTSGSFNTRLYGTVNFGKDKKIQAIRHVVVPSVGVSYTPDFSADRFGYYQEVQTDSLGNMKKLSKFNDFVYGVPNSGRNASMSFSLSNNIEMKVRSKSDTTDKARKITIIDNLSMSSSYNFLADSFKLAPFKMSTRTRLLNKKLNISLNWTIDPYYWQLDSIGTTSGGEKKYYQTKRNIYTWDVGKGLGQVSRASLSMGMSLNPKAREKQNKLDDESGPLTPEEELERAYIKNNPELYVDFNIPWDFRFNYNINYSRSGHEQARIIQSLTFSGNVKLTQKWNMNFSSGFDFESKKFTQTNFGVSRDLHCWQMNFTWTPFGRYESYNLTINAKSSLLQDLKVNKQRSWYDN